MKIEVLTMNKMQESGESLLQLIQNNSLPTLDIFVREVIQNSLDAADPAVPEQYVEVKFNTGTFDTEDLSECMPEIKKQLNSRYPGENSYLSVRDCNTVGLTGPLHSDEIIDYEYGNLLKLVYNISKKQENDGSGGSWGLGKTVYFRLGIGLVIYYSRIKDENNNYSSRLAITLIENEKKADTLISKQDFDKYVGVAWWGDHYKNTDSSCPLTDESEIKEIIDIFGIEEYSGNETGTTVIIPYFNDKALLENAVSCHEDCNKKMPWLTDLNEYLRIAVQRWYTPRINNPKYCQNYNYGKFLKVYVDDELIKIREMQTVFQVVRALYNKDEGYFKTFGIEAFFEEINLRNTFESSTSAGTLRFVSLDKNNVGMGAPNYEYSPFLYCNNENYNDGNPPIICFTRRPGMIVDYDTNGSWNNRIGTFGTDKYIIALFVPYSDNLLKQSMEIRGHNVKTLEDYLRAIEYGDHTSWEDVAGKTIVKRIKDRVGALIKDKFAIKEETIDLKPNNRLSRQLADLLLPKSGFGKSAHRNLVNNKKVNKTRVGSSRTGKSKFSMQTSRFSYDSVVVNGIWYGGKRNRTSRLELFVDTDNGILRLEQLESSSAEKTTIKKCVIKSIKNRQGYQVYKGSENIDSLSRVDLMDFSFRLVKSSYSNSCYAVEMVLPNNKNEKDDYFEYYVDCDVYIKYGEFDLKLEIKVGDS